MDNLQSFTYADISHGLTAVVSIRHPDPWYEGATKDKLGNDEVETFVDGFVEEAVSSFLDQNPEVAAIIVERAVAARRERLRLSDE